MSKRECPACESQSIVSIREAKRIYPSLSRFGADAVLEDADRMCTYCRAYSKDGEWDRAMSVGNRAWNLSQAGTKSKAEYKQKLTRGELPSSDDDGGPDPRDTEKAW